MTDRQSDSEAIKGSVVTEAVKPPEKGRGGLLSKLKLDEGSVTLSIGFLLLLVFTCWKGWLNAYHEEAFWPLELLLDLIRDAGIAFAVGGIVSLGIERVSRNRFLTEVDHQIHRIEQNVINAAYLKTYPSGYTDAVIRMLETTRYFKFGLNITMDLLEIDDEALKSSEDFICHIQTTNYRAKNITRDKQKLRPRQFLDVDWDGGTAEIIEWRVGDVHLKGEAVKSLRPLDTNDSFSWYVFPEEVDLEPGQEVFVEVQVKTIKRRRDTTTWCGIQPADSLTFTLNHPPDFEAYAQAKTSSRDSDVPVSSNGRRVVVNIFKPLLPYMTIEYGWRPCATPLRGKVAETGTGLQGGISAPN